MEPNLSTERLERGLALAVSSSPLPVVLGWLQAGARPTLGTIGNAIEQHRAAAFCALLNHIDRTVRATLPELMTSRDMLDDDDMLDAWIDRLTPDDLNERPAGCDVPMWFIAFIHTPAVDHNDMPDRARGARLPYVLAKLRNAGADLDAMRGDPDHYGLDSVDRSAVVWLDDHYVALRMLLRVPYERKELHAVVDEALAEAAAPVRRRARL